MSAPLHLAVPLASLLVTGTQLAGQSVSARAVIAAPKSSVRLGGVTERVDGWWGGVVAGLDAGRFRVTASGTRGQLTASEAGTVPKRDVGEISVSGRYEVRPWLGLDLGYVARAFSSAAGHQRWDMIVLGAAGCRDLGTPAVRAVAGFAWLPVVKIGGQEAPTFALRSDVGLSVAPTGSPLAFTLAYRVERFRFAKSAARSEQFEALTLSVGVGVKWSHLIGRERHMAGN